MANRDINKELERAVFEGNLQRVKGLLSAGANFTEKGKRDTLLHITDSVEITKALLFGGADVNAQNCYNETPLHYAIIRGKKLELVRELLKYGADVNAENEKGNTALNLAVKTKTKNLDIVKELLEYGADINIRNWRYDNYSSPLDNAICNLPCAKLLIMMSLLRNFSKDYRKIIDLAPYKGHSNYCELSRYLGDCVGEVLHMKTEEIKNGLPLYEFVTNKVVTCNNQLSVKLAKINYSLRYPIYYNTIFNKMKPFLERADLLKKLVLIQFYTLLDIDIANHYVNGKKIILDLDSTYNMSEYLSNDDLLNLLIAFDDSNKYDVQSFSFLNNPIELDKRIFYRKKLFPETSSKNNNKRARIE